MTLSAERIHRGRATQYPWERKAIDHVIDVLADINPNHLWELHELHDPSTGRLYEVDLLVLTRHGLFLIEVKSHPGELRGDLLDWEFVDSDGTRRRLECPYPLANHKARILASLLEREFKGELREQRPYVNALVLAAGATKIRLEGGTPPWLFTRGNIGGVLANGLPREGTGRVVDQKVMRAVVQATSRLGLKPSQASRIVGGYRLGALLDDGEGYQEHAAVHDAVSGDKARVRSYLVPSATSSDRRHQLERAARREADVLARLGQHPYILRYRSFVEHGPLGPAVVFEDFEDGVPLHAFLRAEKELAFDQRLHILQQIVEGVAHCHRAGVLHRNLSPLSVLVRTRPTGIEVRLHRFQTAARLDHSSVGTLHVDQLAQDVDRLYQAPEVLKDPAKATEASDVFSLGCLAWLLLTGQHPAPTLQEREARLRGPTADEYGGLRISSVRTELADLDEPIEFATQYWPVHRAEAAQDWFESYFLEQLTRPPADPAATIDPMQAQKGTLLPGGYQVVARLGTGATAVVLKVHHAGKGRDFALKVPHDAGCEARLEAEANVLRGLRHQHIVETHGFLDIGGRRCLLMDFAGDHTLGDRLRDEGLFDLDVARRFGDDLLSAVQYLEENGVTHRDIKPGNLGFSTLAKKQQHLALFDFSLAAAETTAVGAGTPEWRDPWLHLRGRWDAAADLWAAAAVLYFMLVGKRPEVADDGPERGQVRLEAERFDAAIRDRAAEFFRKAFAPKEATRFETAEQMRSDWVALFTKARPVAVSTRGSTTDPIASATPTTAIDALGLSARARSALDRAGVATVADLLQLPRNQLSVVRGVGRTVANEILDVAQQLRARFSVDAEVPLLRDWAGPRLSLTDSEFAAEASVTSRLGDAGISHTADLAAAPLSRVENLVGKAATRQLRDRLEALAAAMPAPGSLGDWVRDLLGVPSKAEASLRLRVLFGLDPFPDGRADQGHPSARTVAEVAAALGISPAQINSSMQFMREQRWPKAKNMAALRDLVSEIVDHLGPVAPIGDVAVELARRRGNAEPDASHLQMASALVRVALELRPDPASAWQRIHGVPWLSKDTETFPALKALADEADRLAVVEPLPSTDVVCRDLAAVAQETALEPVPIDRLVHLAARASIGAAPSARLEIYPRGMDAARALQLSVAVLQPPGLTVDAVRVRVRARYPEAAPLPDRPHLDALLHEHGLVFADGEGGQGEYVRRGLSHATTSATLVQVARKKTAVHPRSDRTPEAWRAQAFQDALDRSLKAGRFRVVQVVAHRAGEAAKALSTELGVPAVSLDHRLWAAVEAKAKELEIAPENIVQADRDGPGGPSWALLRELVEMAATALVDELLAHRGQPLLLTHPGVFARFGLSTLLDRLVQRAELEDGRAVLLLVASHADGLAPSINGVLPVPAPLPSQRLSLPDEWLANEHRAAADL